MKMRLLLYLSLAILLAGCFATTKQVELDLRHTPQNNLAFVKNGKNFPKITPKIEKRLKKEYLSYYFSPWKNPQLFHSVKEIKAIETQVINNFIKHPGWAENWHPYKKEWAQEIKSNMNLSAYPNLKMRAITINSGNLRVLPSNKPSFSNPTKAGQGYPFDNLQASFLRNNMPVYVLHTTRDGAWKLIITPNKTFGWIKSTELAYVSNEFIKKWQQKNYIVTTKDHSTVFSNKIRVYFLTRIGEVFPLYKVMPYNYKILIAVLNKNGYADITIANISKKYSTIIPLHLTEENIALIANESIGLPYGWGSLYGYRDCSDTTKSLFAPFAIWLPRNSYDQAKTGEFISLKGLNNKQKKQIIAAQGIPFLTLLWIPGHITLYIGKRNDKLYIFHAPWGLHTRTFLTHRSGRAVIGHAAITPLDFGKKYLNVPKSILDKVQGMVILIK